MCKKSFIVVSLVLMALTLTASAGSIGSGSFRSAPRTWRSFQADSVRFWLPDNGTEVSRNADGKTLVWRISTGDIALGNPIDLSKLSMDRVRESCYGTWRYAWTKLGTGDVMFDALEKDTGLKVSGVIKSEDDIRTVLTNIRTNAASTQPAK